VSGIKPDLHKLTHYLGARKVDSAGKIVGEFIPNLKFRAAPKEKRSWPPGKK
jgi:hypothetical protein